MRLGWMRLSDEATPALRQAELIETVAQADALGLDQIYLSGFGPEVLDALPEVPSLDIGLDFDRFPVSSPRETEACFRAAQDKIDGRLFLGETSASGTHDPSAPDLIETILSDTYPHPLRSDYPMAPPRPEVLVLPHMGQGADVARAAANGFHALSAPWQSTGALSRHWPGFVAAATHSALRARPCHWHVARLIHVSDDREAATSYRTEIAQAYLERAGVTDPEIAADLIVAGTAEEVIAKLRRLRARVGPFGTVHCVDPGLAPNEAARQRVRLARDVMPALQDGATVPSEELETT